MHGMNAETRVGVGVAAWSLAGVAAIVGVLSLGPGAWTFAAGLTVAAIVARLPVRIDALLIGAAIPLLLIAVSNASGPGWSCHSGRTESGCDELLDPRPFLLWTVLLLGSAVVVRVALRLRRSHRAMPRNESSAGR
jgi:hypothetical protein